MSSNLAALIVENVDVSIRNIYAFLAIDKLLMMQEALVICCGDLTSVLAEGIFLNQ